MDGRIGLVRAEKGAVGTQVWFGEVGATTVLHCLSHLFPVLFPD